MADQEIIPRETISPANFAARPNDQLTAMFGGLGSFRDLTNQPMVRRALPAIGMIGALAVAAIAWWSFQSPSMRPLYTELNDADKSAVADALQSASIAYTVDRDTGTLEVGENDVHKARMMLAGQGLPKAAPGSDTLLSSLPMGASRAIEGETLRGAREADLARTIEAIDAVKTARVHLATPEASVFVRDQQTPTASIMLTLQTGRTLSQSQVRAIKHLTASSVPGMNPNEVSIIDQSGELLSQSDSETDNKVFQLQLRMEERYRQTITSLLAPVVGHENFSTELHVDVDQSESQSTRETYPKDDRALRKEQGNRTSTSESAPAIGIPGALSNQPPQATEVSAKPNGTQTTSPTAAPASGGSDETYTRSFDVGREISVTHQPDGKISRLSVAVAIREMKGAKPRSRAEMAALEALVKGAVGFDAARGDVVAISARPFTEVAVSEENIWDKPWFMVLIRQIGAVVAAILAFFFIGRPLLRSLRAQASRSDENGEIERQLLSATNNKIANKSITLDMIEAEPSYEARANLIRDFVQQDSERAVAVVRQLMQEGASG